MPKISVEYEMLAAIQVDTDTGQVDRVVVWPSEFNCTEPYQFYTGYDDSSPPLREYLTPDSPIAKAALTIADKVSIDSEDFEPRWHVRPE